MKKHLTGLLFVLLSLAAGAQGERPFVRHKIAVFAPLYLDSVFDAGSAYRFGNTFPRFISPGLDFYQGALMALDSLERMGAPLEVFLYDSRSRRAPISQKLNAPEMRDVELIIGHANSGEVKLLADAALRKKVPFVSATLPNDAGVSANPYLVVLNSTLRTHIEGIYQYLQRYHRNDKITLFRKNGVQENQIRDYFLEMSKNTASTPLKINVVDAASVTSPEALSRLLDSTRKNVCISGSLDENFGVSLSQNLSSVSATYPITMIGMPTWDGLREFTKPDYKEVEIVYSTPFYYTRGNSLQAAIANDFEDITNSRPTDMFYRGYEVTLRFALLLLETKKDVASNLTRKGNTVFTPFDIQPVFLDKSNMTLDYFENKKLHFVRITNGVKSTVN